MRQSASKRIGTAAIGLISAALLTCVDFPNTFERIDADMVRVLDFIYEPAEAAPGDTVEIAAVFAGKPVDVDMLSWRMARDIVGTRIGVETPREIVDLDGTITEEPGFFSPNTSCIKAKIPLPADLMRRSAMIPDDWASLIPNAQGLDIPAELQPLLTRDALLQVLERSRAWAAAFDNGDSAAVENNLMNTDPFYAIYKQLDSGLLNLLLQAFTMRVRLYVDIAGAYTVESDYSLRYHRYFARLPGSGVFENTNPVIDSIGIYAVAKANLIDFDPETDTYQRVWHPLYYRDSVLLDTPTVSIDKGYSYFVAGYADSMDSVTTLDAAKGAAYNVLEDLRTVWFHQLNKEEVRDLSPATYMNIVNIGGLIEPLFPAGDRRLQSAVIWLQVFDYKLNVLLRPRGSTLAEAPVHFSYTDAYLEQAGTTR